MRRDGGAHWQVNLDGLPCVNSWLGHAQGTKKRIDSMSGDFDLSHVVEENVLVQSDNLRTHPSVSGALRSGRVQVFGWVYSFETGSIAVYDPRLKKYLPSTEVKEEAEKDASRFAL
jgi:carbonic anhydrase